MVAPPISTAPQHHEVHVQLLHSCTLQRLRMCQSCALCCVCRLLQCLCKGFALTAVPQKPVHGICKRKKNGASNLQTKRANANKTSANGNTTVTANANKTLTANAKQTMQLQTQIKRSEGFFAN